ncbi:MAG TPA: alpha/beta hydrolase, partial [Vicinamibacteria bacterium]|nr:alpha/beta hydrolase [Vicinamibacteria bacterium]
MCAPAGQEYLRAHRAFLQLAERLAALGFDVLRFDYFGCGDSAGDDHEGRLDVWLENTKAAIEEVEALCGSDRVSLVGLRLGAALAAQAQAGRGAPSALVLWDPVLDGPRYLEAL